MFSINEAKINYNNPLPSGHGLLYPYGEPIKDKQHVVKIIEADKRNLLSCINEIVFTFDCDHPHVLPITGYALQLNEEANNFKVFMKLPRMQRTLAERIEQNITNITNNPISEACLIKYFYSIIKGLEYLHKRHIAHRDIQPGNIFLDDQDNIRIGNLGNSYLLRDGESFSGDIQKNTRDIKYVAPELKDLKQNLKMKDLMKVDCWSLGITMLELCIRERNVLDEILSEENDTLMREKVQRNLRGQYNVLLITLLTDLIRLDPEKRIDLSQVKRTLETHFGHMILDNEKTILAGNNELTIEEEKVEKKLDPRSELDTIFKELGELWKGKFSGETDESKMNRIQFKKVEDQELLDLTRGLIAKLKERDLLFLKQFRLNMDGCKKITDLGVMGLTAQIATHLQSLVHLTFDFRNCIQIEDAGVKYIGQQIGSNLNQLRYLNLNFDNCEKITDKGVCDLGAEIGQNLNVLEHLFLNFEGCIKLTDKSVKELSLSVINKLLTLQTISLDFRRCNNISDGSLKELFNESSLNSSKIQHIILDFMNCEQISNEGLSGLARCISKNLPKLLNFSLRMRECNKITDEGIRAMAESFGQLENLQCFGIEFQLCKTITGQGIKALADQISSNLRTLQYLQLGFPRCQRISDEGVEEISSCLEHLVHLEHLALNFSDCEKITDSAFRSLSESIIKNNPHRLKSLFLDFSSCPRIKEVTKNLVKEQILTKNVTQLSIR